MENELRAFFLFSSLALVRYIFQWWPLVLIGLRVSVYLCVNRAFKFALYTVK